jgi:hypothetical protein
MKYMLFAFVVLTALTGASLFWALVFVEYGATIVRAIQDPRVFGLFCWTCGVAFGCLLMHKRRNSP